MNTTQTNTTISTKPATGSSKPTSGTPVETTTVKLTAAKQQALARCEESIRGYQAGQTDKFFKLALACFEIQRDELYLGYGTEAAYFKAKHGYSRSHSLRLAQMGQLLDRVSPSGDLVKVLASDAHLRPLLKLTEPEQDAVIALALTWAKMANLVECPAKLVLAARTFLNPPTAPREQKDSSQSKLVARFRDAVAGAKSNLPATADKEITQVFEILNEEVDDIAQSIIRSTGIGWTLKTWNHLHGCSRKSKGCDRCYAAKFTATRSADVYPGLAVKKTSADGEITYAFTGKIQLAPQDLVEPLLDNVPKYIFVNSMSDLFHSGVPDEFIEATFTVMELAFWHTFQVLTKRTERMAAFTQKRYADKEPPKNIWLGTSTEDQDAYDKRMPHLKNVKAAVRWLSCEPLLGPIQFDSMDDIDWIVVGGESGPGARPMKKEWAAGIRDACVANEVPFFFKQWGAFNEAGKKAAEKTHPPTLDGVEHQEYPIQKK